VYNFTRNYNKYTREHPDDLSTLLQIASSLEALDHHQRVAAGNREGSAAILTNRSRATRSNISNNARAVLDRRISLLEYALKQMDTSVSTQSSSNSLVTLQMYLSSLYAQSHEHSDRVISFLDAACSVATTCSPLHLGRLDLLATRHRHVLSRFNDVNYSFLRDEFTQRVLGRVHEQLNRSAVKEATALQAVDARTSYWDSITASAQTKNERGGPSGTKSTITSTTPRYNYSPQLQIDTECLQIDLLATWLLVERLYGHKERQMAVIQVRVR
jgi:hypothetical protein